MWVAQKGVAAGNALLSFAPRGKATRAWATQLD